jgi:ATP-dependent Lhr-like helicase
MLGAVRSGASAPDPEVGAAADVLAVLRTRGACFRPELATLSGRLPAEVDEGLWDLVSRGIVTADAFSAVRSLLSARDRWRTRTYRRTTGRTAGGRPGLARRRAPAGTGIGEGRWSLLPVDGVVPGESGPDPGDQSGSMAPRNEELAEEVAWQLLARWGVVAWEVWSRESFHVPWREVVWALRRLEARGLALGGRFVMGLSGEQYSLPEAAEQLAKVHRQAGAGEEVMVAGADPLNMTGSILGGARVPTRRNQRVTYRDGVVVDTQQAG